MSAILAAILDFSKKRISKTAASFLGKEETLSKSNSFPTETFICIQLTSKDAFIIGLRVLKVSFSLLQRFQILGWKNLARIHLPPPTPPLPFESKSGSKIIYHRVSNNKTSVIGHYRNTVIRTMRLKFSQKLRTIEDRLRRQMLLQVFLLKNTTHVALLQLETLSEKIRKSKLCHTCL